MTTKQIGKAFAVLMIGAMLLVSATGSEASMMNWTETVYTASNGALTFDWDRSSMYDLAPFDASVKKDQIFIADQQLAGTIYEFVIPNFYDPLPKKIVDISISGRNSGASGLELARVLNVFGSDSPFGVPGPSVPAAGKFVDGTLSSQLVTEQWNIFPNPDFDYVKLWAPTAFELDSIQIVTQSVPLPASILLFGSAIAGLAFVRRKVNSK